MTEETLITIAFVAVVAIMIFIIAIRHEERGSDGY